MRTLWVTVILDIDLFLHWYGLRLYFRIIKTMWINGFNTGLTGRGLKLVIGYIKFMTLCILYYGIWTDCSLKRLNNYNWILVGSNRMHFFVFGIIILSNNLLKEQFVYIGLELVFFFILILIDCIVWFTTCRFFRTYLKDGSLIITFDFWSYFCASVAFVVDVFFINSVLYISQIKNIFFTKHYV